MKGLTHRCSKKLSAGKHHPLGANIMEDGVNFAIFSQHAKEVYLLLFDSPDGEPTDVIRLEECTKYIWHVMVHGVGAGQLYAYKIKGDYDPPNGYRYNENKCLIDPYAKALTSKFNNKNGLLYGYYDKMSQSDLVMDTRDNTSIVPKCIVVEDDFDWQGMLHPEIPFDKLIIYETHLKGFTAHPSSKVRNHGSYLGFIEKIPHLQSLGINAVELLPIQEFYTEDMLAEKGLSNYWGYNTIGFFAPELSYSSQTQLGCQVNEFKTLVRELHRAGIEVILDVVYNHSGEGNHLGPTLSFKGIDNLAYYCLMGTPEEKGHFYMNYTGCGNSLNLTHAAVIRFVMDSLRYWVEVMHVDGFRFDLASVLGRKGEMFEKSASFFDVISQDPVLNNVKLIAEPWDLGTYEVGNFPTDWSEWNGKFRDCVRRFGKGDGGLVTEMGFRLTGSHDLYGNSGRSAYNSINFITCHDGFTLHDLVTYNYKHNEANLEKNYDGSNDNNSWNCGMEGETTDVVVNTLRRKLHRNYAAILMLSLGTPMILGGDEVMRTQRGNNNAYCQDNELSWFDWALVDKNAPMFEFYRQLIRFRNRYPVLQKRHFLSGDNNHHNNMPDIAWYSPNLSPLDWHDPENRTICYLLNGHGKKRAPEDYFLYIILNSDYRPIDVRLPQLPNKKWHRVIDTQKPMGEDFLDEGKEMLCKPNSIYAVAERSVVVLIGK